MDRDFRDLHIFERGPGADGEVRAKMFGGRPERVIAEFLDVEDARAFLKGHDAVGWRGFHRMRAWPFLLLLLPPCGHADKPKLPSSAECAAIARFNDLARAEIRGQKPGELEQGCKPQKKAPPKKR